MKQKYRVLLAVNHDGDSDSTGAICGNIVGALYGLTGLRKEWVDGVELSDYIISSADRLLSVSQKARGW